MDGLCDDDVEDEFLPLLSPPRLPPKLSRKISQVVTIEEEMSPKSIATVELFQVVTIEDELSAIGENQKQLEVSEEKARRREEKYQV